jgi:glutamate formiminotransferase
VSMNLLDFRVTGLAAAFDAVAGLAGEAGVDVAGSEIVGLVPQAALAGVDPKRLKLRADPAELTVEERVRRALADRAYAGRPHADRAGGARARREQGGFPM